MLIYEYKLDATNAQYNAMDEAMKLTQFVRNKCVALWMNERGISKNDLQCYCAHLAKEYPFANNLNSQARQASADRAWFAIARFYDNCKQHKAGKKGYPTFQHNNRSVEYKTTGWKLEADGKHITFTDGCLMEEYASLAHGILKPFLSSKSNECALSNGPMDIIASLLYRQNE